MFMFVMVGKRRLFSGISKQASFGPCVTGLIRIACVEGICLGSGFCVLLLLMRSDVGLMSP